MEGRRFGERLKLSVESQLVVFEGAQQVVAIFGGKDVAECANGEEEARVRRADKFSAAQNARRDNDMQVKVVTQFLIPGVQDGDEPWLAFELPFWVQGEARERFVHGAEEQSEHDGFVLENERVEFVREGEHAVEVWHIEQFTLTLFEPLLFDESLALGTVAVAA